MSEDARALSRLLYMLGSFVFLGGVILFWNYIPWPSGDTVGTVFYWIGILVMVLLVIVYMSGCLINDGAKSFFYGFLAVLYLLGTLVILFYPDSRVFPADSRGEYIAPFLFFAFFSFLAET